MPVFLDEREKPADGHLPRRHVTPDCPALEGRDAHVKRVIDSESVRERTERCREGCWDDIEAQEARVVERAAEGLARSPGSIRPKPPKA